ncbi:hypothetical protein Ahy_B04g072187 [Arachis hypogaea]|uniref:Uncharacterized protein n=1 Tax=Arachis hypogaea TaxID=3818 RepID=G0Y6V5_ARAHY|nr:unknown [Arachis hypogaea]RYR15440.1 hypothetical protein Ahy_B04g072187 [Arachis hypogaea]
MEGELRCEGEERTATACPAAVLPLSRRTRHTSLPVAAVISNDGGERKRRTREERGKPLCCCRRAGGLAVGGAAAMSSPPPKARRRLGHCQRKRACTRGCWSGSPLPQAPPHLWPPRSHIEVAVLLPLPLPGFLVNGHGAVVARTTTGAAATCFP